jgi:hypothetical protein
VTIVELAAWIIVLPVLISAGFVALYIAILMVAAMWDALR